MPEGRRDRRPHSGIFLAATMSAASWTSSRARASPRNSSGSSSRRCRGTRRSPRCLLSVVDRTVEVQAERTLRAEMLRDSLTGLPNRLAFSEAIENAGEQSRARPRACRARRRHAAVQPDQRNHGQPRRRRAADHLRSPPDPGASCRGRACADRRQRIRRSGLASPRRRRCAQGRRADPAGDDRAVQAFGARNPRRMRDRRGADACRPGRRRAVPQRAVRGQAGQNGRQAPGL